MCKHICDYVYYIYIYIYIYIYTPIVATTTYRLKYLHVPTYPRPTQVPPIHFIFL